MAGALVADRPGLLMRLWMRLSPIYDEQREAARARKAEKVIQDAIDARLDVERKVRMVNSYRATGSALRRRP